MSQIGPAEAVAWGCGHGVAEGAARPTCSSTPAFGSSQRGFAMLEAVLAGALSLAELTDGLLSWCAEVVPCTQSALLLRDDGALGVSLAAHRGASLSEDEVLWIAAAAGRLLRGAPARWVEDVAGSCDRQEIQERSGHLASALVVPLRLGEETVGVLQLGHSVAGHLGPEALGEIEILGPVAGRLIRHAQRFDALETERDRLTQLSASRARALEELEGQRREHATRQALEDLSVRLCERSADPASAVLANLDRGRQYVDTLAETLPPLLALGARAQDPLLRRAYEAAEKTDLLGLVDDFSLLLTDVSEGARQLRQIGEDHRDYVLGSTQERRWSAPRELVLSALSVVQGKDKQSVELCMAELPRIRCRRLELIRVLVDMLETASLMSGGGSGIRLSAEQRGERLSLEVSAHGDWVSAFDQRIDAEAHARLEVAKGIVREAGGRLAVQRFDDLTVLNATLPLDPA